MDLSRGAIESDWDVDTSLVKKIFEETLSKDQLLDLVKKRVKPDHWKDGRLSYFRVHKIIQVLNECSLAIEPNLDIALDVLSLGKAKIHPQSHSSLVEFIQSQVENKDLSYEELQMQVECLVPGCYPIGPECESLGITGSILLDEDAPFPNPLKPDSITNRVILELSQYLSRVKKDHSDMAKWIRKVVALGTDQELIGELVACWCSSVIRGSSRKKRVSMSRAQQYLAEPFIFFGLDQSVSTSTKESTDSSNPLSNSNEEMQKNNGHMEADSDSDVDITALLEDNEEEETVKKDIPSDQDKIKCDSDNSTERPHSNTAETPSEVQDDKKIASETIEPEESINEENGSCADQEKSTEKDDDHEERISVAMDEPSTSTSSYRKPRAAASVAVRKMKVKDPKKSNSPNGSCADQEKSTEKDDDHDEHIHVSVAMDEPSTSTSSYRKPRAAASVAVRKMKVKDPKKRNSPQVPKTVPVRTPRKGNVNKRASTKPQPRRMATRVARGSGPSRKRKAHESSDEEEEMENDDEMISSTSHKKAQQWRDRSLAQANEDLETMFAKIKKLKKEFKIALEYLEDEASTLKKQLQAVKKQVLKAEQSPQPRKKVHISSSEDEDGGVEEDSEEEEEDSKEESGEDEGSKSPVAKTRRTTRTKKITVQVHPSVKTSLRKPVLQLRSVTCADKLISDSTGDKSETEPEHHGARRTTRKCATSSARDPKFQDTKTSLDVNSEPLEFDKEKLFSSKACVSLVRIADDVMKKAEKIGSSIELDIRRNDPPQVTVTNRKASPKSRRDINSKKEISGMENRHSLKRRNGRFKRSRNTPREGQKQKMVQCNEQVSGNKIDASKNEVRKKSAMKDSKGSKGDSATRASPRCSMRKATNTTERPKEGANKRPRDRQKSSNTAATKAAPEEVQASPRHERGKKRSLNDFVKMLNSSKKIKGETEKRTSPRRKKDTNSSETNVDEWSQDSELLDSSEEFGDDDFLENTIKMQLEDEERKKSRQAKLADAEGSDNAESREEKEEEDGSQQDEELGGCDPEQDETSAQDTVEANDADEAGSDGNEPQADESIDDESQEHESQEDESQKDESQEGASQKDESQEGASQEHESQEDESKDDESQEHESQKDDLQDTRGDAEDPEAQNPEAQEDDGEAEQPMDTEEGSNENQEDKAEAMDNDKEALDDFDFPGDDIIGKVISHRCSLGKHGLYKWYEGKVLHKATSSEIVKLDEEQFNHLNNLKTIYTVKYDDYPDPASVALEVEWDEGNLKIVA